MAFTDYNPSDTLSAVFESRTLAQGRTYLMQRLGFSAQAASPPPGMTELLNGMLLEAQTLLFEKYEAFRTMRYYSWPCVVGQRYYDLASNQEAITIATPVNAAFATAAVGGTLAAGTYYYRVAALNAYGQTLASTETSQVTTGATSTVTVNWGAVTGATGYKVYGRTTGAEQLIASVGAVTTYIDTGAITPAGTLPNYNTTAISNKLISPWHIEWAGVQVGTQFIRMAYGIPPGVYGPTMSGIPSAFQIRQVLEIWPAPSSTTYTLWIKGNFGLAPFVLDTDTTTINSSAVFMMALFLAKAHYGQPDAGITREEVEGPNGLIENLVAGSHQTNRYIPGMPEFTYPPQPTMTAFLP